MVFMLRVRIFGALARGSPVGEEKARPGQARPGKVMSDEGALYYVGYKLLPQGLLSTQHHQASHAEPNAL